MLIDACDLERVNGHTWYADRCGRKTYAAAQIGGTKVRMHRLLCDGEEIDHADGNGLNNQRGNLRPCTRTQNCANRAKGHGHTSAFKGVSWSEKLRLISHWRATIQVGGKQHALGYYKDERAAANAYDQAARQHFGEFARLNFPYGIG